MNYLETLNCKKRDLSLLCINLYAPVVRKLPASVFYEQKQFSESRRFMAGLNNIGNLDAPVAQLDRAAAYGAVGWGFDSLRVH